MGTDVVTFEQVATPEEIEKAREVEAAVSEVVATARAILVRTPAEAQQAASFLTTLAAKKRETESARKFLVDPLNAHVKAINARFKAGAEPLAEADALVRGKVIEFDRQQEVARLEEQARLDAEHRAREEAARREADRAAAAAQAEREAAVRAAEQRQREAEAAERRRVAALEAHDRELTAELDALDDAALRNAAASPPLDRAKIAGEILDRRREAKRAHMAEIAAREEEAAARERERLARETPPEVVPEAVAAGPTSLSGIARRKTWDFEVIDPEKVPRRFLKVDDVALRAAVRAGEREIAGCRIFEKDGLAVGGR